MQGDCRDGKLGIVQQALGAPDAQRLRDLARRGLQMLDEQARQVARPYPESFGQRIDTVPVQSASFDQGQCPFHGCLGALPCRTERRCFGAAAKAGSIAGTFGGGGARIELHIARERRTHLANRAAVDSGRLDRDEQDPVGTRVAPSHGFILSGEVEHAAAILRPQPQRHAHPMTRSENDRCVGKALGMEAAQSRSARGVGAAFGHACQRDRGYRRRLDGVRIER